MGLTREYVAESIKNRIYKGESDPSLREEYMQGYIRLTGPTDSYHENGIVFCEIQDEVLLRKMIKEQKLFFKGRVPHFKWSYSSLFSSPEHKAILVDEGFKESEPGKILIFDMQKPWSPCAERFEIRELVTQEDLKALAWLQLQVWGSDTTWLAEGLYRENQAVPGSVRIFGAFSNNQIVCVGWIRINDKFGSLFGGSTLQDYRGRGAFKQVVTRRLEVAKQLGLAFVKVEAMSMSAPVFLNKFSFEEYGESIPYIYKF